MDSELQKRALDGGEPVTCRPADLLEPEVGKLTDEFRRLAQERGIRVANAEIDDVLTYALFPQIGLKFLENRDNPDAFEPVPGTEPEPAPAPVAAVAAPGESEAYQVTVDGRAYNVVVAPGGDVTDVQPAAPAAAAAAHAPAAPSGAAVSIPAPLAGNIFKINVTAGQVVSSGDIIMILEAMKMETEVRSPESGTVQSVMVKEGDAVQVGDALLTLG